LALSGLSYWPSNNNKHPDIIDIFVKKLPRNFINIYGLFSDHASILLKLGLNVSSSQRKNLTFTPGQTNRPTFKIILNYDMKLSIFLNSIDNINVTDKYLKTLIQKAALTASKPYNK